MCSDESNLSGLVWSGLAVTLPSIAAITAIAVATSAAINQVKWTRHGICYYYYAAAALAAAATEECWVLDGAYFKAGHALLYHQKYKYIFKCTSVCMRHTISPGAERTRLSLSV